VRDGVEAGTVALKTAFGNQHVARGAELDVRDGHVESAEGRKRDFRLRVSAEIAGGVETDRPHRVRSYSGDEIA
jgi:hypothetical protein